jgi:hypothetical protein
MRWLTRLVLAVVLLGSPAGCGGDPTMPASQKMKPPPNIMNPRGK